MARRRKGKKVLILILILLATGLFYVNFKKEIFSYLTNIFSAEKKDINNNAENKPKLTGMTEKELVKNVEETDIRKKEIDFNGDGKKEIFITTFANSGAKAAIGNKDGNLLTPVFNFDVRAFPEIEFKIEDVPGNSSDGENWFWEGEVYSWSGGEYKYDVALTRKILSEQPRKMINGEPVF